MISYNVHILCTYVMISLQCTVSNLLAIEHFVILQGPNGTEGPQGPRGEIGPQGVKGAKGEIGEGRRGQKVSATTYL